MALNNTNPHTLADVLSALTDSTHEDNFRHRTRVSAINRIATFLHRPPSDLPADVRSFRRQLAKLHPVQCGVSRKTLSNFKSSLAEALKVTGAIEDDPRGFEQSEAWATFLGMAVSDHQRWALSRLVDYCCARKLEPRDVTQEVFDKYRKYLEDHLLTRSPADHCKAAAVT